MRRITIIRLVLTAFSMPFLVVGYLNIEKWAERHGYDQYLIRLTSDQGESVVSPFVLFALRPEMPFIATAVLAFMSGVWGDALLRRQESKRISPKARMEIIGIKSIGLANRIDFILNRWSHADAEKVTAECWSEFLPIGLDLEKSGLEIPEREIKTKDDLGVICIYLRFVGPLLEGGHMKQAKQVARNLSGNPTRRDVRFLLRWLQALVQKIWQRKLG